MLYRYVGCRPTKLEQYLIKYVGHRPIKVVLYVGCRPIKLLLLFCDEENISSAKFQTIYDYYYHSFVHFIVDGLG